MRSGSGWIMIGLAALVAGAAVIVYVQRGERSASVAPATTSAVSSEAKTPSPSHAAAESKVPKPTPAAPPPTPAPQAVEPLPAPPAAQPATGPVPTGKGVPNVIYDVTELPEPAHRMFENMILAAQSGDIEQLRPVLEMNELKPMVAASAVDDPIAYWKQHSADGEGRDVLAALLNVLNAGFVRVKEGKEEMYVWPYFAEADLTKLSPAQIVELYRVVPAAQAVPMQRSGKYGYYRVGIAADGVWHYFLQ
jgi:hypothetical protein